MDVEHYPTPSSKPIRIQFDCPHEHCANLVDTFVDLPADDGVVIGSEVRCLFCSSHYHVDSSRTGANKSFSLRYYYNVWVRDVDDTEFDDEYDEFLADYQPDDPFDVYSKAIEDNDDLLHGSQVMPRVASAFNKLLFLNHVTALEAYLSDMLITIIIGDKTKLIALVGSAERFRKAPVSLLEVAKDPDYAINHVKRYLQRFSFHDLENVAGFYRAVLKKFEFFENDANKVELLAFVQTRHHLVHRNGRDNEGEEVIISNADLARIKEVAHRLVLRIEGANDYEDASHFIEKLLPDDDSKE